VRRAQRLNDAHAQGFRCRYGGESRSKETLQTAVNDDPRFAIGAVVQVDLDTLSLLIAKGTIEEEVGRPFHIVTEHRCVSFR